MKVLYVILLMAGSLIYSQGFGQSHFLDNVPSTKTSNAVTGDLYGKVTDAVTGAALPGASIYLHDLKTGAIADNSGMYRIRTLNPGKYLIEVSYQGYGTVVQTVPVNGDTHKDFVLKTAIIENEEVTVTGVSRATRIRQSPQPVSVVKHADLISISATNAIDALTKTVPGVSALSTGPAISKPFIRGLGYNRVVTVNDGIRQEGQQWGDEHGLEVDEYSIQRIEVLKGPASLMYGSDAMAGVINIMSQRAAPEGLLEANVSGEYQSNSALRGGYTSIAGTKHGLSWNAYGSYKAAEDYKNQYDGRVLNSRFNNRNFGGMLGYGGHWGHSQLLVSNFDQRLGIIEGARDSATGKFVRSLPRGAQEIVPDNAFNSITPEVPYQHIRHFKATSDNSFLIGKSNLDVIVGYQHNQRQEFGSPDSSTSPTAWFNLQTVNYSANWHLPYAGNWRTTIGIGGMSQTNKNETDHVIIPDYSLFDIGGFVFTQYTKNKLNLSGGLRFDNRHVEGKGMMVDNNQKFNPFSNNFSNISGSVGLSYEATKALTLKLNIARGFRAPNFAELASNGVHEGTNRYEKGDQALKSEISLQADGGIEVNTDHLSFETSVFYNHINNFIFYRKLLTAAGRDSLYRDPVTGENVGIFQFTQETANLYGAEVALDVHPHPLDWLHFRNAFSYTRGQFTNDIDHTKNIPLVPAPRLITELAVDLLPKGHRVRNLYLSVESDYNFKQDHPFTGYGTELLTGDYWIVNAGAGIDWTQNGKKLFSIHLNALNLGDVAYQSHLSRLRYTDVNNLTGRRGVFNMGRNFGIKIDVPLSFNF